MWTVGSILKWTQDFFQRKGIDTPRLDAEVLLSEVLACQRIFLYVNFDKPLEEKELAHFRALVKKRAERISVAHIIGRKEFMGLSFKVTLDTLVPRPDTEILVGAAAERLKKMGGALRIADIGTGTGAIGLSVCSLVKDVSAVLTDISDAALCVAKENAAALSLTERREFVRGDLAAPLNGQSFAAVLSNPPYIPDGEVDLLAPEVKCEPPTALFGGADGLDFYRRLAVEAPPLVQTGGFVAVEVGAGQAPSVAALLVDSGLLGATEIIKDLAGIERVVIAWKRG